ncbi:MAG TPA: hypothetical protein ACFCUD_15125 [Cyclobacteriaceae bacterium]
MKISQLKFSLVVLALIFLLEWGYIVSFFFNKVVIILITQIFWLSGSALIAYFLTRPISSYLSLTGLLVLNTSSIPVFIWSKGFLEYNLVILLIFTLITGVLLGNVWGSKLKENNPIISWIYPGLNVLMMVIILRSINIYPTQVKFNDYLVYSSTEDAFDLNITIWEGEYWIYYDQIKQITTKDYELYYEPMVIPALSQMKENESVLIIGGENGYVYKLLKDHNFNNVDFIHHNNALNNTLLNYCLEDELIASITNDVKSNKLPRDKKYDLIIMDIPYPGVARFEKFYTLEYFSKCFDALSASGILVSPAGNPYLSKEAFYTIEKTVQKAGFKTLAYHNEVPALGHNGWILGSKKEISEDDIISSLRLDKAYWINEDALRMMLSFGKVHLNLQLLRVNSEKNMHLKALFEEGSYDL